MSDSRKQVLIVDDSMPARRLLRQILEADPEIAVMGEAADPYAATALMNERCPDVVTLDIAMPRMDGVTFLQRIMAQYPIPVVICSAFSEEGSQTAAAAIESGAAAVISKPSTGTGETIQEWAPRFREVVKSARPHGAASEEVVARATETVIAVGASTGGTDALPVVLQAMPEEVPGIVIVQHMPAQFTGGFAARLHQRCRIRVREAQHNDPVVRGQALVAPGNAHLLVRRNRTGFFVEVKDGPLVNRQRPAVDVLFRSVARAVGPEAVGVLLTGMGEDGAQGMVEMKRAGAVNIAQDEATSVVFGMPAEAIRRGAVDHVLPLHRIAGELLRICA